VQSVWSAAPTSTTSRAPIKPSDLGQGLGNGVTGLSAALDDLNLDAQSQLNGRNGYGEDEYEGAYDGYEEPLGHNIEHACRWVLFSPLDDG